MNIQKIPLKDRLRGLSRDYPAHHEYIPVLLRIFAAQPITVYLKDYPEDLERLAALVHYPVQYMSELCYGDVAVRVRGEYGRKITDAGEVAEILAKPMIAVSKQLVERMKLNG